MKDWRTPIREAAEHLGVDESTRITCPFCLDTTEHTMSVTRTISTALYHCFRATCGKSGVLGASISRTPKKEFKPRVFNKPTDLILMYQAAVDYLGGYGILPYEAYSQNITWLDKERRLVFPLYDHRGYKWGTLTKAIDKGVKPKTILYKENNIPSLHFPRTGALECETLVLVEDVMSAIKLSNYTATAAILGTHINEELILYIKSLGFKDVRIMFDNDATAKALGYVNKYKGLLNLSVVEVSKPYSDPKDIPHTLLKGIFK